MIKAITLDIAGVFCTNERRQQYATLAKEFDCGLDTFYDVRKKHWLQAAKGKLTAIEYISKMGKELGVNDLRTYEQTWSQLADLHTKINEEMQTIVRQLKRSDYVLF